MEQSTDHMLSSRLSLTGLSAVHALVQLVVRIVMTFNKMYANTEKLKMRYSFGSVDTHGWIAFARTV